MPVRFLLPQKIFLRERYHAADLFVRRRVGFGGFRRTRQDYQFIRRHLDRSGSFRGWLGALAGEVTISRADTVVGEHFTAAPSRFRLRTEIELDRFPRVASLSLQAKRCSGLIAAMHHAIFAAAVAGDAINDPVAIPVSLFQQL